MKQGYWETRATQLVQQSPEESLLLNQWIGRTNTSHVDLTQVFIDSLSGDNPGRRKEALVKRRNHTLYRMFDRHRQLLYVGITMSPANRFASHRHDKLWWEDVHTITIERFDSKDELEAAELMAIRTEYPQHNVQHNPRER